MSCIKRKFYVQFLGGREAVMPPCYPATTHCDAFAQSVGDEREGSQVDSPNLYNCVSM